MEMSWSVPHQAILSIVEWDDTGIVYYSLSGQTHLLNDLACQVLQLLQRSSETISSLVVKLCDIYEVEDEDDLKLQILKLMREFESLGLIEVNQ